MDRIPVSTVLLTKNSAKNLPAYHDSMRDIDDIIVLDGGSTDATLEIAKQWDNARIFPQNPTYLDDKGYITNFSALRNEGYALAKHRWILCVDSDEEATPELIEAVRQIVAEDRRGVYYVKRQFTYEGVPLKTPSWIETDHIRFFHLDWVRGCLKATHERLDIVDGAPMYHIDVAVKIPMAPTESLRAKYNRNLAIEVESNKNIEFTRWCRWIFIRNILSIIPRPLMYLALHFKRGPGRVQPFIYDYEQMRYSWLMIWKTCPLLRTNKLPVSRQFTAYFISGVISNLLDIGLYLVLLWGGMWYITASVVADIVGILCSFTLHKYVAFRKHGQVTNHMLRYAGVVVFDMIAITLVLAFCVDVLDIPEEIAKFIANGSVVFWNFLAYKFLVYV